jgi:hypothetical protein
MGGDPLAYMTIRDNALWAKHIEGDPRLVLRILTLPQDAALTLRIEGTPVRFRKMRDGSDGRPTPGLRPADPAAKRFWDAMQDRRGETVRVALDEAREDPQLASLTALLAEWDSPEDAEAYDRL